MDHGRHVLNQTCLGRRRRRDMFSELLTLVGAPMPSMSGCRLVTDSLMPRKGSAVKGALIGTRVIPQAKHEILPCMMNIKVEAFTTAAFTKPQRKTVMPMQLLR